MRCTDGMVETILSPCALMPGHGVQLGDLSWLTGCWSHRQGESGSGAYWPPLAGKTMVVDGRTFRPQRLIYRNSIEEGRVVRIEGERRGQHRSLEFQFVREACPR